MMMEPKNRTIPFSPPDISELEIQEVVAALRSGWITTGPRTKQLEKNIAQWIGVEKCVCLNSQTACAEMVLRLLGVGPGDEVITSAYTSLLAAETQSGGYITHHQFFPSPAPSMICKERYSPSGYTASA